LLLGWWAAAVAGPPVFRSPRDMSVHMYTSWENMSWRISSEKRCTRFVNIARFWGLGLSSVMNNEKKRHMYINNYHNITTKIPTIKCIFLHLSTYYMQPKVPRAVKMQAALCCVYATVWYGRALPILQKTLLPLTSGLQLQELCSSKWW